MNALSPIDRLEAVEAKVSDLDKLERIILACERARGAAMTGRFWSSHAGLAVVNAVHDLLPADELYEVAQSISWPLGIDPAGEPVSFMGAR